MVYITGDMHGEPERFSDPRLKKLKKTDTLIICGDFGFLWDGSRSEQKFLKKISNMKYTVCFVDGTHENFEMINKYPVAEWNGGKVHQIGKNLYHLMRGQIFEIDGLKIFTMGGGESPDIDIRFDIDTWSRDEIPTQQELLEGAKNLEKSKSRVDIIVTHEPPATIKDFLNLKSTEPGATRTTILNSYFEELGKYCKFNKWYFGSMHIDKFISSTHTAVFNNIINGKTGELLRK